jgi:hypothetical protein
MKKEPQTVKEPTIQTLQKSDDKDNNERSNGPQLK